MFSIAIYLKVNLIAFHSLLKNGIIIWPNGPFTNCMGYLGFKWYFLKRGPSRIYKRLFFLGSPSRNYQDSNTT